MTSVVAATMTLASCTKNDGTQQAAEAPRERIAVSPPPPPPPTTTHQGANIVDFQPGIRIDYRMPQVEVDAEVILRTGELELFAYSRAPTPKEHETILKMQVKAEHIHLALGLIGLVPGNPVLYDWESGVTTPARGDPVNVFVRFERDGKQIEQSACDWMFDLERRAPMAKTHWLFTGSRRDEKGRFAADVEGTVVTVVNFDTSVLSLPESHSDSDTMLWLAARTEVIPETGTKVTLVLRPAAKPGATAPASSKE